MAIARRHAQASGWLGPRRIAVDRRHARVRQGDLSVAVDREVVVSFAAGDLVRHVVLVIQVARRERRYHC